MNRFATRDNRLAYVLRLAAALVVVAAPTGIVTEAAVAQDGEPSSVWKDPDGKPLPFQAEQEIIEFLRTATIESVADIELGVTNPRRVVLSKDGVRMRAALRDYDRTYIRRRFDGEFYGRLRDSYVFDVAAYALARILDLNNIPPVTLRRVGSSQASLQAWLEGSLLESDRIAQGINPPVQLFRRQTQDMRVFDSLIGNVDRNTGNVLMDGDWKIWLIDHSRSFMRNDNIKYLDRIQACSRGLFARIKTLSAEELLPAMSPPLTEAEVDWVLRRRDKVVAHIDSLITERGEDAVLFDDSR